MKRIAILGGGVAGVVAARTLASRGDFAVDVIERNNELGGLHRSVLLGGVYYDIGAFLFDSEHELLKTFPFLYDHFVEADYLGQVITQAHSIDKYPMTLRGYLRDNGVACVVGDGVQLLFDKFRHRRRDTLVAYVKYYLGARVYQRSGLKAYIERFYAAPDSEVDLEFAYQRLQSLPIECGLRRNFVKIARDEMDTQFERRPWHCYFRPKLGFGHAYALIHKALVADGVRVQLDTSVTSIERDGASFRVHLDDGNSQLYDSIISTIPVATVMRAIGRPMGRPPETIRLTSLCYRFQGDLGFNGGNILYNFTYQGNWKRLNAFSPVYGKDNGDDYFIVECTQRPSDNITPEDHRQMFEENIKGLPILKGTLKYQDTLVTNDAYPFFKRSDMQRIESAREELRRFGVLFTGRQGSFAYTNAHDTAVNAKALVHTLST